MLDLSVTTTTILPFGSVTSSCIGSIKYTSLIFYLDTIMDLLNFSQARRAILDYYQTSGEPQAVQEAIKTSQRQARNGFTLERIKRENIEYVFL